jgi:hypothetical protein
MKHDLIQSAEEIIEKKLYPLRGYFNLELSVVTEEKSTFSLRFEKKF